MSLRLATAISARLETRFVDELRDVESVELVRRCADTSELLAAVEAGAVDVVALSADFPGVNGALLASVTVAGATIVGVSSATSLLDARQFEGWGLTHVYLTGSGELQGLFDRLLSPAEDTPAASAPDSQTSPSPNTSQPTPEPSDASGARVIAVLGCAGAPGRTTVAINVAALLTAHGRTLLIDADTVAPSVAGYLGILDDVPGTAAAGRLADAGTLNSAQLNRLAAQVAPNLHVLSGIGGANRWPELGRHHVERILDVASAAYDWIVLDTSGQFSADDELLFDAVTPSRHAATLVALERAELTLMVAAGDPIGLQRLVSTWPDLNDRARAPVAVLINKTRARAIGGEPDVVIAKALERFAGLRPLSLLPDIGAQQDAAMLAGRSVTELGKATDFVAALGPVLEHLGVAAPATAKRARLRRGRRRSR